jgi:hypothetical protein
MNSRIEPNSSRNSHYLSLSLSLAARQALTALLQTYKTETRYCSSTGIARARQQEQEQEQDQEREQEQVWYQTHDVTGAAHNARPETFARLLILAAAAARGVAALRVTVPQRHV